MPRVRVVSWNLAYLVWRLGGQGASQSGELMHDMHMTTSGLNLANYDLLLVGLSYFIAVIASYAGLSLAQQVRSARGRSHLVWLVGGAVALGLGVWAMHFVAMLALDMQMAVRYDLVKTGLSLVFAVAASGLALSLVTRNRLHFRTLLFSGIMMGLGIAAMHYTGMAAMHMAATLTYRPLVFAASILVAIIVAIAALWLVFYHSQTGEWNTRRYLFKLASAGIMGAAIVGMHYTGMAAA
jgi:NO-binding membrane sensor protein with MHYT domain